MTLQPFALSGPAKFVFRLIELKTQYEMARNEQRTKACLEAKERLQSLIPHDCPFNPTVSCNVPRDIPCSKTEKGKCTEPASQPPAKGSKKM